MEHHVTPTSWQVCSTNVVLFQIWWVSSFAHHVVSCSVEWASLTSHLTTTRNVNAERASSIKFAEFTRLNWFYLFDRLFTIFTQTNRIMANGYLDNLCCSGLRVNEEVLWYFYPSAIVAHPISYVGTLLNQQALTLHWREFWQVFSYRRWYSLLISVKRDIFPSRCTRPLLHVFL